MNEAIFNEAIFNEAIFNGPGADRIARIARTTLMTGVVEVMPGRSVSGVVEVMTGKPDPTKGKVQGA